MDYWEVEDLAMAMLGLDEDTADIEAVEHALDDKYGVSLESFMKIAEALMPFTIPAKAAISGELFHGFVKDGAFICKQPVRPNVKEEV
jgi:hypothetical protein